MEIEDYSVLLGVCVNSYNISKTSQSLLFGTPIIVKHTDKQCNVAASDGIVMDRLSLTNQGSNCGIHIEMHKFMFSFNKMHEIQKSAYNGSMKIQDGV